MPSICCVVGCSNAANKSTCLEKRVSLHGFPLQNKDRLKIWLQKLKRKDFKPTAYTKICSDHFEEDNLTCQPFNGRRDLKKTAVPTIFKFSENDSCKKRKRTSYRPKFVQNCEEIQKKTVGPQSVAFQTDEDILPKLLNKRRFQGNRSVNKNNGSNDIQVPKKSSKRLNPRVTPLALSFFSDLQVRYKFLKDIFRYLNSGELVTASSVCKLWKDVALQDEMWKTINLNGVKVCNWEKLVDIIKKKEATQLDMRGMKTFEDCNRTWHEFVAVLQQIKTTKIEEINFGFVTVSVLHAVLDILTDIKVLTAESIVDVMHSNCYSCVRIRIGSFARLKNLKKLHLRGVKGIQLPLTQHCSSLSDLGSMQTLEHLSLTSLRNIPASEFMFVQKLVHITTLEIGSCATWNAEVYKQLLHLKHLTRLRLECGFDIDHSLSQVFETLTQLKVIELETFKIDEHLMKRISLMPHLEGLSLWPDDSQAPKVVNSVVMECMKYLNRLKIFKWQVKAVTFEEASQKMEADDDDVVIIEETSLIDRRCLPSNDIAKKDNLPFAKGILSTGKMTNIENLNSYILKIMNRKYKNGKILLFHSSISGNIKVESRISDEDLLKIR